MSLREEIEQLQNPAPLFDPEEDYWNDLSSARLCSKDTGEIAKAEHVHHTLKAASRLNLEIITGDKKYAGDAVSRKRLAKQRGQDTLEEDKKDIDIDSYFVDIQTDSSNCREDDDHSSVSDEIVADDNDSSEDNDDDEVMDSNGEVTSEEESDQIQPFGPGNADEDIKKGHATSEQLKLWDYFMDLRIQMQPILQLSNQLPQNNLYMEFINNGGRNYQHSILKCKSSIKSLLNELLTIQQVLFEQNPETEQLLTNDQPKTGNAVDADENEIPSDDEIIYGTKAVEERSKDCVLENKDSDSLKEQNSAMIEKTSAFKNVEEGNYEKIIAKRHNAFNTFRNSAIQKWNDKTHIAFGKFNSKKFSGFNQSAMQQIEQMLSNKERLIRRTQLKRLPVRILGKPVDNAAKVAKTLDAHLKDYDSEIFDDSDFYQQQLRELIESKSDYNQDTDPLAMGRQWLEFQQLRSKVKRKVDTKASKGRKLRYDVHDKLINYSAPIRQGNWTDIARNNLCASLFGKRNMKQKTTNQDFESDITIFT